MSEAPSQVAEGLAGLTAVILAGGLGTRLRSVVADRPKVLADIGGRPFLAYLLEQLAAAGARHVVLCTGYQGDRVRATLGQNYAGLRLIYSQESSPLGTAGALRLALPLFQSDSIVVLNGDSFCGVSLQDFWSWSRSRAAAAAIVLKWMSDTRRYGRVQLGSDDRISGFSEKDGAAKPGWINAGIYLLDGSWLEAIPEGTAVSLERDVIPSWLGRGVYGYQSSASFLDIGIPEGYSLGEQFFA